MTAAQVRKDFSLFGITGNRRGGYKVDELADQLNKILGKDQLQEFVLIGVGNIGRALLHYPGFREKRHQHRRRIRDRPGQVQPGRQAAGAAAGAIGRGRSRAATSSWRSSRFPTTPPSRCWNWCCRRESRGAEFRADLSQGPRRLHREQHQPRNRAREPDLFRQCRERTGTNRILPPVSLKTRILLSFLMVILVLSVSIALLGYWVIQKNIIGRADRQVRRQHQ